MSSITFDEIEGQAEVTLGVAYVTKAKATLTTWLTRWMSACLLSYLDRRLRIFSKRILCVNFDRFTDNQVKEIAALLSDLHATSLGLRKSLESHPERLPGTMRRSIEGIMESTESVGDVLESIYLSQDQQFRSIISGAIDHINGTVV